MHGLDQLVIQPGCQALGIRQGQLEFADGLEADATFYFDTPDQALQLLTGNADVFQAFMEGQFRADGYLMWTFALLNMFRGNVLEGPPRD